MQAGEGAKAKLSKDLQRILKKLVRFKVCLETSVLFTNI
jgi:hypothetical protein